MWTEITHIVACRQKLLKFLHGDCVKAYPVNPKINMDPPLVPLNGTNRFIPSTVWVNRMWKDTISFQHNDSLIYRPQRSWAKVISSQASVCPQGGGVWSGPGGGLVPGLSNFLAGSPNFGGGWCLQFFGGGGSGGWGSLQILGGWVSNFLGVSKFLGGLQFFWGRG